MCAVPVVAAVLVIGACADDEAPVASVGYQTSAPSISVDAGETRGQVVSAEAGPDAWAQRLPANTRVKRLVYRSTSGVTGESTEVSGAVFVPPGERPSDGWPLIVYAHGTTGITRDCAPSDSPTMFGDIAAVASFVRSGYAVVTTDYQGLGTRPDEASSHPYMEPRTAAYNMIDAVRAARKTEPTIGTRFVSMGASQGGAAAWATAEEFASYGAGSGEMLGAVAVVPFLNPADLVDRAQNGELTPAQRYLYPILVSGAAQTDSTINPDDYLHGIADERRSTLISCSSDKSVLGTRMQNAATTTFTSDAAAADELRELLGRFALPRTSTTVPILAIYGGADDIIAPDVMEVALGRGCALGETLQRVRVAGQGHSLNPEPTAAVWIASRFDDEPARGDC